jgi:outer membrane receptor protein involved in Fe transport
MAGFFQKRRNAVAVPFLLAALALPVTAVAQIEEITVTARKKEESLQDVPISIAAFGEEQLRQQGLDGDNDIADFTVNFNTLTQTGRDFDRPVIRGMAAPSSRGEANASYFIDGIFISGSIASATTSAVQRVEILRGPQSAQFGRATFSGAINYVTKDPTEEFSGDLVTKVGSHETYEVGGLISGPIIEDKLLFLLSANWSQYGGEWNNQLRPGAAFNQPEGEWLVNPPQQGDSSSIGGEETTDVLAKLVWQPWEGGEFNLKYGYTEADDETFSSLVAPGGPAGVFATLNCWLAPPEFYDYLAAGNTGPYPGEQPWWRTSGGASCGELNATGWEDRVNIPDYLSGVTLQDGRTTAPAEPGLRKTQNRYLLQYEQAVSDWVVTARGGANTERYHQAYDLDHTEARAVFGQFNFDNMRRRRDWSGELRVATPADLPVRAEVGGYYYDAWVESSQRSIPGPGAVFGGPISFIKRARIDTQNSAVFAAVVWDISEAWELDLEGRYASEKRSLSGGNGCNAEETYYNLTPRASINFKPTPEVRFYVQVANGDKPGDFNPEFFRGEISVEFCDLAQVYTTDVVVKPEEQWTYEVGAKTRWLDDRLQANLAIFLIDWSEQSIFQTQNFANYEFPGFVNDETLITTILRNVGDSRNVGAELETILQVTEELTLIANYGFTHAKFREGYDSLLFDLTGNGDVSGRWIPSAPEHSVVLGVVVSKPVSAGLTAMFRTDAAYESERYVAPSNFTWIGERVLVNLRAGVESERWTVTAYVRNLMDDQTPIAGLSFVNFGYGSILPGRDAQFGTSDDVYPNLNSLSPARGRDFGLELQYKFGAQ